MRKPRHRTNNAEREVILDLEVQGFTVFARGWPDLLAIKGDEILAIEVKPASWDGTLKWHQMSVFKVLRKAGLTVEVRQARTSGRCLKSEAKRISRAQRMALKRQQN